MASGKKIQVLIISNNHNWENLLKQCLDQYADYLSIFISHSIVETSTICFENNIETVIGNPHNPDCAAVVPIINSMPMPPNGRQIIFLLEQSLSSRLYNTYLDYKNIVFLQRPYSTAELITHITAPFFSDIFQHAEEICKAKLEYWKFPRTSLGWRYTKKAALLYYTNPRFSMDAIYREIASDENTSEANVRSAIRNAIIAASKNGSKMKTMTKNSYPTNKELITQLYDEITRYLKR